MRAWLARNRRGALAIGAIAVTVIVTATSRLSFLGGGEIDWDEGVYWLSMQSMQAGHALFVSVYSSQPPAFLLVTEPPWALLGGGIAAARAVMLGWSAIAVVAGSIVGWRLGGRVTAVAVAVTLAVDPLMVRQSLVLQADGPATSLGLVAVLLAACGAFSYFGRPPIVLANAAATGQFPGGQVSSYQAGLAEWHGSSVTFPVRYTRRANGESCTGKVTLDWHGFFEGWQMSSGESTC